MATQARYIAELADGTKLFYSRGECVGIQSPSLTGRARPVWTNGSYNSVAIKHRRAFAEEHGGETIAGGEFRKLFRAIGVMDRDVAEIAAENHRLQSHFEEATQRVRDWQEYLTRREEGYKRKELELEEEIKRRQAILEATYAAKIAEAARALELALEASIA